MALADSLPGEILDVLALHAEHGGSQLLRPGWGLERPFADHPTALVTWVQRSAKATGMQRLQRSKIWPAVAGIRPTTGATTAITTIAAQSTDDELLFLAESLAHCPNFVLDEPVLVAALVEALDRHSDINPKQICDQLLVSGVPHTSWAPGQPAQQTIDNRDRAQTLADDDTLSYEGPRALRRSARRTAAHHRPRTQGRPWRTRKLATRPDPFWPGG